MPKHSETPQITAGTRRLFALWEPQSGAGPTFKKDRHGFAIPSAKTFTFRDILDKPAALIVAPIMLGKTTVAKKISHYLQDSPQDTRTGKLLSLLPPIWFEGRLPRDWFPGRQWEDWRKSRRHAVWIVDAVDEAHHRDPNNLAELLQLLKRLQAGERKRLRLLVFGRKDEIPPDLRAGLEEIYENELTRVELLPVERSTARQIVGEREFPGVLELIEEADLAAIAGYPCVLQTLRQRKADEPLSQITVWRSVLTSFLRTQYHRDKEQTPEQELDDQFEAAARIAVGLTFGPDDEIVPEASMASGLRIPDVLPTYDTSSKPLPSPGRKLLRDAAYEAIESGMFQKTGNGHRFAQKNIRDWMCAWGLRHWSPEKVTPFLFNDKDELQLEYREIGRLLKDVAREDADGNRRLAEWLRNASGDIPVPAEANPWPLDQVRGVVDQLEERAAEGGWLTLDEERLAKLSAPGLGQELARRLGDTGRPPQARAVSLAVAAATGASEIVEVAVGIIRDEDEDTLLRRRCAVLLGRWREEAALRSLIPFIEQTKPTTRVEMRTVAALISALVELGIWTVVDAFPHLPAGTDANVIDAVRLLPAQLGDAMTLRQARQIIAIAASQEFSVILELLDEREPWSQYSFSQPPKVEVFLQAVRLVADQAAPKGEDLEALIPFCLRLDHERALIDPDLSSLLQRAFEVEQRARRKLVAAYLGKLEGDAVPPLPRWDFVLRPEDLHWLSDLLTHQPDPPGDAWTTLLFLASAEEAPEDAKQRARQLALERAAARVKNFEEQQRTQQRWAEERAEREEHEEENLRSIQEIDREILDAEEYGSGKLLWSLSWVNFSEPGFKPSNVEGQWSDLPADLRDEILHQCAVALDEIDPTPIPEGRTFPRGVVYEGQAFVKLVEEGEAHWPLNSDRIGKWLGSVLCFPIPGKIETLERCFAADVGVTETVVLSEIEREMARPGDSYSVLLQDLPVALWTEKITRWAEEHVLSDELPAQARIPLLRLLAGRQPSRGREVARHLFEKGGLQNLKGKYWLTEPENDLDLAVANVLLAFDPDLVWDEVKVAIAERGEKLLKELKVLFGTIHGGLHARVDEWPTRRLGELAEILCEHFPPEDDPELPESGFVTAEMDLRELRWYLVRLLFERQGRASEEVLDRLSARHPVVNAWLARRKAALDLESVAEATPAPPAGEPPFTSTGFTREQVSKLIRDADYRLVRHPGDLLDVVMEELAEIGRSAPEHLDMLYLRGSSSSEDGPQHQQEYALQAYILCRLSDRLPGRVLDREAQVKWRRRTDIRVSSPTSRGDIAIVVIEVKWSDHRDISTALKNQLGRQYLLDQSLTHGIYAVGWCGKLGTWRATENPQPKTGDVESLRQALARQAEELRQEHRELRVQPFVMNCAWSPED